REHRDFLARRLHSPEFRDRDLAHFARHGTFDPGGIERKARLQGALLLWNGSLATARGGHPARNGRGLFSFPAPTGYPNDRADAQAGGPESSSHDAPRRTEAGDNAMRNFSIFTAGLVGFSAWAVGPAARA